MNPERSNPVGDVVAWIELLNGWGTVGLICLLAAVGVVFWRLNSGATPFRVGDALIDPLTGRASILRIGFFVCLIWTWAVVTFCVIQSKPIPGELLGILAIFVAPLITNRAFEIWDPRTKAAAFNAAPNMPPPAVPPEATPVAGDVTATVNIKP